MVTEADWLACSDPLVMTRFLRQQSAALIDQVPPERQEEMRRHLLACVASRKFGLFACACCRALWPVLMDERSRRAVELTERCLDGEPDDEEWGPAREAANAAWNAIRTPAGEADRATTQVRKAAAVVLRAAWGDVEGVVEESATVASWASLAENPAAARADQVSILRDLIGNPFRPIPFDKSWLTSTVVSLARTIYDARSFELLPVLGDALMDAGCANNEVLEHCRGPNNHVRGCWLLDLLLTKE
jgi:hypothetical protein